MISDRNSPYSITHNRSTIIKCTLFITLREIKISDWKSIKCFYPINIYIFFNLEKDDVIKSVWVITVELMDSRLSSQNCLQTGVILDFFLTWTSRSFIRLKYWFIYRRDRRIRVKPRYTDTLRDTMIVVI